MIDEYHHTLMTPKTFYKLSFYIGEIWIITAICSIFFNYAFVNQMLASLLEDSRDRYFDGVPYKTIRPLLTNCAYLSWSYLFISFNLLKYSSIPALEIGNNDGPILPPKKSVAALYGVIIAILQGIGGYYVYEILSLSKFQSTMAFYIPYFMVAIYFLGLIGCLSIFVSLCSIYYQSRNNDNHHQLTVV